VEGKVLMYADTVTESMRRALDETDRRRRIQMEYNRRHGITPRSIEKAVRGIIEVTLPVEVAETKEPYGTGRNLKQLGKKELEKLIARFEQEMRQAARELAFEKAAEVRDLIIELRKELVAARTRAPRQKGAPEDLAFTGRHQEKECTGERKKRPVPRRGIRSSSGERASTT
jgi:excinuclease ABC subunit B